jgi:hypothetical protein
MELDISILFDDTSFDPYYISNSVFNLGDNAAMITWNNAKDAALEFNLLDNEEKKESFREYIKGFGAWSYSEVLAFSDIDLNALLLQLIAGDIQDLPVDNIGDIIWTEDNELSSRIYKCDESVYYYIGE